MVDNEYRGWHIPEGCMPLEAMTRDERYYPEPEEFRPQRYLTQDGQKNANVLLPSSFIFGYGRRGRICPGQAFAEATIWLAVANIVALFDICKAVDEIIPPGAFIPGLTKWVLNQVS
ncbi:hypothetical protein BN946_scf184868.g17 [Trametes cinnabarina]|uniref:Cytochrome P450 n=1 Tax=Pycnoporus cinnabarinus TaxID=5643 RepID=A0A060SVS7_PYCCI|nr:hypothetical protein BN946_scf184868.g17 [Trametes cinnabarina]